MEDIREYGSVVDVVDGIAKVLFKRSSMCGKCGACGMLKDMSEIIIDVEDTLHVYPGQKVEIGFSAETSLKSAAIAYAFPLGMLVVGLIVGYFLAGAMGWNEDITAAVAALSLTAVSFLVIKMLEPRFKKKVTRIYKMVRIVDEDEN